MTAGAREDGTCTCAEAVRCETCMHTLDDVRASLLIVEYEGVYGARACTGRNLGRNQQHLKPYGRVRLLTARRSIGRAVQLHEHPATSNKTDDGPKV